MPDMKRDFTEPLDRIAAEPEDVARKLMDTPPLLADVSEEPRYRSDPSCPACGAPAHVRGVNRKDSSWFGCVECGQFEMTHQALREITICEERFGAAVVHAVRAKLAEWLRDHSDDVPVVTTNVVGDLKNVVSWTR